jgi:D-aminoacyl-tRNA deacylase
MRALIQRVKRASVTVEQGVVGSIGQGLLVLLGVSATDTHAEIEWMCNKIANLRIFHQDSSSGDKSDKSTAAVSVLDLARSAADTDHPLGVLIVSQFTLYADAQKGFRPSYSKAAPPEIAKPLYDSFVEHFRKSIKAAENASNAPPERMLAVETGIFGAMMDVELINDGPVTIWLEKEARSQ